MKRSRLGRKSALARRTRVARVRAKMRRSSRVRDEDYLAWVRLQPCAVYSIGISILRRPDVRISNAIGVQRLADATRCCGTIDPDHKRAGVGAGKKASDRDAWPVCRRHHGDRHALTGVFKGWTREQMHAFVDERIAAANAAYERHLSAAGDA